MKTLLDLRADPDLIGDRGRHRTGLTRRGVLGVGAAGARACGSLVDRFDGPKMDAEHGVPAETAGAPTMLVM